MQVPDSGQQVRACDAFAPQGTRLQQLCHKISAVSIVTRVIQEATGTNPEMSLLRLQREPKPSHHAWMYSIEMRIDHLKEVFWIARTLEANRAICNFMQIIYSMPLRPD